MHSYIKSKICNVHTCISIKEVSRTQYLGIIFDNNLRWHLHLHNIIGKLRAITYKFIKLKNLIPKQITRIIYFAFCQSIY